MRLPFFDPRREEVVATATDLIKRFGLRAHAEASYLAYLSVQMRSRRHRLVYELVAREIDASFDEAQRRMSLRQDASVTSRRNTAARLFPAFTRLRHPQDDVTIALTRLSQFAEPLDILRLEPYVKFAV